MSRRSASRANIEIELFPFLSILACTIGTLILLIIVLTTQMVGSQREIRIIAKTETGSNLTKKPRYLECNGDGVVIYPREVFVDKKNLYKTGSPFLKLLDELKNKRDTEYLIVAVRPDGIDVFQEIRELIEKQGIDIGYEPIDQKVKLKIDGVQ